MRRTVLVCGIGRCGLTMTMQMLEAGGHPVVGPWPMFEVARPGLFRAVVSANPGTAIKLVDPPPAFDFVPPDFDGIVLLLRRDWYEQAVSQLKLLAASGVPAADTEKTRVRMADVNRQEWGRLRAGIQARLGRGPEEFDFEEMVADPPGTAARLARLVGEPFDAAKAVGAVVPRGPECFPRLLEVEMIRRAAKPA